MLTQEDVVAWLKSPTVLGEDATVDPGPTTPDYVEPHYVVMKRPDRGYTLDGLCVLHQFTIITGGENADPTSAEQRDWALRQLLHGRQHETIGGQDVVSIEYLAGPRVNPQSDPLQMTYLETDYSFEAPAQTDEEEPGG